MNIDAYSILVLLSVLVVLSYSFNYLAGKLKIPSVLLLMLSGIGLKLLANYFGFTIPQTATLLEILGITGLIFIVLEAALDLSIDKTKLPLISRAFFSALGLLIITSSIIALLFYYYYETSFRQALIHAIPLSVISSAIAIPSVQNMVNEKREFVIYESTFSDIVGIIAFNFVVANESVGMNSLFRFGGDLILILLISVASTLFLIFMLNHSTSHVRFFLTFAILILTYSLAKFLHLPSLILILCFGLVLNNFKLFNHPLVRKLFSFEKLHDVTKEMKTMTAETAFIIRTFFFLIFGYSLHLEMLKSQEVILMGLAIIGVTLLLRFVFLRYFLKMTSVPLALITPRGLITILLFYTIPKEYRLNNLSEGIIFVVIVITGLMMTFGLLLNKNKQAEEADQTTL